MTQSPPRPASHLKMRHFAIYSSEMQQLVFGFPSSSISIPDLDRFPSAGLIFLFRVPDFEFVIRIYQISSSFLTRHCHSPLGAGYSISPGRHGQNRAWRVADHALRHAPA